MYSPLSKFVLQWWPFWIS